MKQILVLIISVFVLFSCGDKKQYNEDEMQVYSKQGQEIVAETFGVLRTHLMTSIKSGGIGNAIGYCSQEAQRLMDSMSKVKGVKIRRTSTNYRNLIDIPDNEEVQALNALAEMKKKGEVLHPILKKLDDKTIAYFHPIIIDNPICLNCHGSVGSNIDTTIYKSIKEIYPHDNAIGYKIGDLRGMWSIRFNLEKK